MAFKIVIDPKALIEIQQAIDYYEEKQSGLGEIFEDHLNHYILFLGKICKSHY